MPAARPQRPRFLLLLPAGLALAAALAGCGDSPEAPRFESMRAAVRAVTVPASATAGDTTDVRVNLGTVGCPYSFQGWRVLRVASGQLWVAPYLRRPLVEVICPQVLPAPAVVSYRVRVPDAGPLTLHVVGSNDTLDVPVGAGVHAASPGHTVQLVPRYSPVRIDSVAVSFFLNGTSPALATGRTDAQGIAEVLPPCPDVGGRWDVYAFDVARSQLFWLFELPLEATPCGRALLTVVSYEGDVTPVYLGASPWGLRGWRRGS